jgi:hypothetical protein
MPFHDMKIGATPCLGDFLASGIMYDFAGLGIEPSSVTLLLPMMGEGRMFEGIWWEKTGVNVQVSGDGFGMTRSFA